MVNFRRNIQSKIDDAVANTNFDDGFKNGTNSFNEYSYDKNGNMVKDSNKGVISIEYNFMNLPVKVSKSATEYVVYTYDAVGSKLRQQVFGSTPKITDYISIYVYTNDQIEYVQQPEGRIVKDLTVGAPRLWEYQYFINDNLGNTRVTFSEKATVNTYLATLEDDRIGEESTTFRNYSNTSSFTPFNHTSGTAYTYSQRLNALDNSQVGLAKSLEVQAGDVVDLEVFAKYESPLSNPTNTQGLLTSLISAFSLGTGTTVLEGQLAKSSFTNIFVGGGPWINSTKWDAAAPKAYLNYILFDENFTLIDFGFDQINSSAVGTSPTVPHDHLSLHVKVQRKGYLYVYVSNEQPYQTNVYFDDLKIVHSKGVEQISNYYAFGLEQTSNGFKKQGMLQQPLLYNGKEIQDELGINWLDYGARMYMADIGRWGVMDPLSELMDGHSPYCYVLNNPVSLRDIHGLWPEGETVGADGLTNSQWMDASRPGAPRWLASTYQEQNRLDEFEKEKQKRNNKFDSTDKEDEEVFRVTIGNATHIFYESYFGDTKERPGDDLIKEYEANEILAWAYQWSGEALLEVGVGGDFISAAREIAANSEVFQEDERAKKLNQIQDAIVATLTAIKKSIPNSKLAEPYITLVGLGLLVSGGALHEYNSNILAPQIKAANPEYYRKFIDPTHRSPVQFNGAGSTDPW